MVGRTARNADERITIIIQNGIENRLIHTGSAKYLQPVQISGGINRK